MQLDLPVLPDLNTYINAERTNRFRAAKLKRKIEPVKKVTYIEFIWKCKNKKKDPDGISGFATKVILDGLVQAGCFWL